MRGSLCVDDEVRPGAAVDDGQVDATAVAPLGIPGMVTSRAWSAFIAALGAPMAALVSSTRVGATVRKVEPVDPTPAVTGLAEAALLPISRAATAHAAISRARPGNLLMRCAVIVSSGLSVDQDCR